jgi:MFS family permease
MISVLAQASDDGPDGPLGALALYLTFAWLASAIICAYLSDRKGYGERPGLATGLLLNAIGIVIWLAFPAKATSMWKTHGVRGTDRK